MGIVGMVFHLNPSSRTAWNVMVGSTGSVRIRPSTCTGCDSLILLILVLKVHFL